PKKCNLKNRCNILVLLIKTSDLQSAAKPDFYTRSTDFRRWHIFCPFSDTMVLALLANRWRSWLERRTQTISDLLLLRILIYWRHSMSKTLDLIKEHEARWIDLRFTDTKGKEQHVTYPSSVVNDSFFEEGKMFDGSSIAGWKGINESDMILMPDDSTAMLD